ncbi:ABC transporter permease [Corynebacterium cystitidis]|uniref:ABC transporter permease n=1 Tax=Corynebacterium cystitidis TaxID=35757 RepID=UPI00211E2168|nr:ABC transporter permease [Corynebacterium cystitidis]
MDARGRADFTIVGIVEPDFAVGGWAGLFIPADQYWSDYSLNNTAMRFHVQLADGADSTDTESVMATIRDAVPNAEVLTGEKAAKDDSAEISKQLSFITYILAAFGFIALLVGAFVISNTFSMTVAQRTRDFALLRAVGMSCAQLTGSVVAEAITVGLVGSILGVGVGAGLVAIIVAAMERAGFGFPNGGIELGVASVLVPILVGVVVTVWGAWVPARHAGSVHPVEAMRSGDESSSQPLRARTIIGVVFIVVGILATVASLTWDSSTANKRITLGFGALGLIIGWLLSSPIVVRAVFPVAPSELRQSAGLH